MIEKVISQDKVNNTEVIDSSLLLLFGGAFKKYEKGEYLFHEGQEPHFYQQLHEGKIIMLNETEEGKTFIQGFFIPGQSFGDPPIFYGGKYRASAIAVLPSIVIRLNIPSFMQLIKENFQAHLNITTNLSLRLKWKQTILKEISLYNPEHRIITLLNMLRKPHFPCGVRDQQARINYTRQQIAAMTGLRVETVIRVMRNLCERKIISIEKGKIFY
jgi:CRP/FNR family transcriptional regulator, cyclic AMP receptor protein